MTEESPEIKYRVEPLRDGHDREAFSCGVEDLDDYLHRQAGQDLRKRVAAVFVATPDTKTIAGFYTLSAHTLRLGDLPAEVARKLPRYPDLPATLLGRLAVSRDFRGQRLGEFLLMDALRRALIGSVQIASVAVVVDAKDDAARKFYERYDFVSMPEQPNRLFYLMKTIAGLFSGDVPGA